MFYSKLFYRVVLMDNLVTAKQKGKQYEKKRTVC